MAGCRAVMLADRHTVSSCQAAGIVLVCQTVKSIRYRCSKIVRRVSERKWVTEGCAREKDAAGLHSQTYRDGTHDIVEGWELRLFAGAVT